MIARRSRDLLQASCRQVHDIAASGFGYSNVSRYEAARPGYRDVAVNHVHNIIGQADTVVELGAGTGKFTKSVVPVLSATNYIATEPSAAFRESLKESGISHDGFQVKEGTGDSIPVAEGTCDAIVVAQAWHWMANEDSLKEIKRALKAQGKLVMIWNAIDLNIAWQSDLEDILTKRYDDDSTPRYITGEWENVFSGEYAKSNFSQITKWSTADNYKRPSTAQDIVNRILSVSVVARRSESEQKQCEEEILALLASHEQTRGSTEFQLEYRTDVAHCHLL